VADVPLGRADQDDVVGMMVDDGLALAPAVRSAAQPVPPDPRSRHPLTELPVTVSAAFTLRLRSPPSS